MMWFYNLKISAKLLTGFIMVALIAGVVGIVGIMDMNKIDKDYTDLYQNFGKPLNDIGDAGVLFQRIRVNLRDTIMEKGSSDRSKYVDRIKDFSNKINESLENFEKSIQGEEARTEYKNLQSLLAKFEPERDKVMKTALANREDEALIIMRGEAYTLALAIDESINKLQELKVKSGEEQSGILSSQSNTTIIVMIIVIVIAMLVAAILGVFISRIISSPVKKMAEAADKLAVGDINVNVEATTKDEIGSLMRSFGKMVENIREQALTAERIAAGDLTVQVRVKSENDLLGRKLSEMVEMNNEILGSIYSASEQVAGGARQVSSSSQALSQGSSEQASSIEEITSSMTQIASQTKQNALNANQANELALAAKDNATQGNSQMQEMVKAMAEINDASSNISKIIKVIDEIAFQTNILALNAAVEAARAGQHGKGFAVVAEEVRNLAARSANAAKETTDMIEGSIRKVEVGTNIANHTAKALSEIVGGVAKAAALVGDIAQASNEQASGISQINQAISQVAQVVQTNSATAEESAAASEELSSQAELLRNSVSRFKLKRVKGNHGLDVGLNPDILRMIEDAVEKKKPGKSIDMAAQNHMKTKISLDGNDFGKY